MRNRSTLGSTAGVPIEGTFAEREELVNELARQEVPAAPPIARSVRDMVGRLDALADWHALQASHPIDVSGSDRTRAARARFHVAAALDIRLAAATLDELLIKDMAP